MSEQPVTSEQTPSVEPEGQEKLSFMDKAAGVFYEPSKVFESVKKSGPKFTDWFVPVLLLAIVTSIATYVRMMLPDLASQFRQMQEQRIDKMVADGKMPADQAQQAKDRMDSASGIVAAISSISALIAVFIFFFIISAVILLIGRLALKGSGITYAHAMVVSGIPTWIGVVGAIIGIVISVMFSRFDGGLHLGMFVQMNTSDKTYSLLKSADLFTIWSLAASSIGIGTLSGKKGLLPIAWIFGVWIVIVLLFVFPLAGVFGG